MRWLWALVILAAVSAAACTFGKASATPPQLSTNCGGACVRVLPLLAAEGAPLNGATLLLPFTRPVKPGPSQEIAVVNAALNLETREPEIALARVKSLRVDPHAPRQLVVEVDALLADGAAVAFGAGAVLGADGTPVPAFEVRLTTPWSPFAVALAGVVWEPADRTLFTDEGLRQPRGATAEAAVRQELEARLRIRPGITDAQVAAVLAQYDGEPAKKQAPDHRVRAGLLLLTGTSAEYAIEFVLADTNRRGVPFEPIRVQSLAGIGAFAAVFYHPLEGKLRMTVDRELALDSLDAIAVVLAHETLHSDLGGGSATEETLAMAADTRVYQELLLFDPALASIPSPLIRAQNRLALALRNSGRFAFPRGGVLPRPGIDDALRGTGDDGAARSFKDLLFKPDFYGDYNPKAGDAGSEVLEAYYRRISGNPADQGRLKYDQHTLKLFDMALDNGFTDEQILAITAALGLRPVPVTRP